MIPISRKRLFTTTVGVILAVAIVFTSYTLGNNMARYDFYKQLDENPYQISMQELSGDMENITAAYWEIKNISHIYNVELLLWTYGTYYENMSDPYNWTNVNLIYILGYNITVLEGRLPIEWNEIVVTENDLQENNWSVGEKITLYLPLTPTNEYVNYTIVGVVKYSRIYYPSHTSHDEHSFKVYRGGILSFKGIKYLEEKKADLHGYLAAAADPEYLLKSTDYNEASRKMRDISTQIQIVLSAHSVVYYSSEEMVIAPVGGYQLIFALFYSLPVIVVGAYLSRVGIEIELFERRREIGILKIRGAKSWSLTKLILIEALIYSVIGGTIGYLLGESLAYLSNFMFFNIPYFILDWGVWEFLGAMIFSALLFFIALATPWGKMKKEPIINLISHYSQSFKEAEYSKMKMDTALSILFWVYLITAIVLSRSVNLTGGFNILIIIAFIILFTFSFMFPLILILLPLTMSRLLTMGTSRVYKVIASGVAKVFKTSGRLAEKSLERSPKRAAYLAFILAFVLTLSTFLAVTMDNSEKMMELSMDLQAGGDVKVRIGYQQEVPWELFNDTSKVSSYVIIYRLNNTDLFALDMRKYIETIYDGSLFLKEGKLDGSGVVITSNYAKTNRLKIGDTITVLVDNTPKVYKIEAIMYSFPGIQWVNGVIDTKEPGDIVSEVILRAKDKDAVMKYLDENGYDYEKRPEEMQQYNTTQLAFINTLLLYLVILGAAAIFIVQYSALLNRRGEIALYKVRGARNSQIAAMLMTEGLTVIVLSTLIGVLIGIALSYVISSMMMISGELPEIFTVSWTFVIYTSVLILAYIISQYLLSYIFARTKPSEIIRGLGGEI